ncbi:MAG: SDR family NAD(P)-dependent oxidoreductase [Armatimonas sp.]
MLVLVTGATGFLGTRLVNLLVESGKRVRVLGRNHAALEALRTTYSAQPFECDLRDRDVVVEACRNVEQIYHLGALNSAWAPASEYQGVNVEGTQNVLAGCQEHGVGRIIFASTLSVIMDSGSHSALPEPIPYPAKPVSMLAQTKRQAEELILGAEGVSSIILRLARVYGPGDPHFLPPLIALAQAGKLKQIGSGRNRAELLYRDNAAHALMQAGTVEATGAYIVTGGEATYPWSVLRGWLGQLGVPTELPTTSLNAALVQARLNELVATATGQLPGLSREQVLWLGQSHTYDDSATMQALDYTPPVTQNEGIARTMHALSLRK